MYDVTNKYCSMIEAFECDFSLALDRDSDFSLLNELSFGLRHNQLKIIQFKE